MDVIFFDVGVYVLFIMYFSGVVVIDVAMKVWDQVLECGVLMLGKLVEELECENKYVVVVDGQKVSFFEICLYVFYEDDQC